MHRMAVLLWTSSVGWGMWAQECPTGWESVAREYLSAQLEGRWDVGAKQVVLREREAWLAWNQWQEARTASRMANLPDAARERQAEEKRREGNRLGVSVFPCEPMDALAGRYRVRVDPDGRSFKILTMELEGEVWGVVTRTALLDAEQRRTATAYFQAVDAREWDKAEAWVAQHAIPRFKQYQLEVEAFLKGSPVIESGQAAQAELRRAEWDRGFLRAEKEGADILVVHMEFPSATTLSCEMTFVDGAWRILHR